MKLSAVFGKRRNLRRYRQIVKVLVKYGFGEFLERMTILSYLRIGKSFLTRRKLQIEKLSYAQRIRLALEELGPTFVKLGQVLSMRPFLIPLELIVELSKLQDQVAPFDFAQVKEIVESELGAPLMSLFSEFDTGPIASASLSQVHKAKTVDGRVVVVKVQRAGIRKLIDMDMEILRDLTSLLERYVPESKQYDPKGMVEELARSTKREIDFNHEARNIEIFAENFKDDPTVFIPKVFWNMTTSKVLTMEFIDGTKISNLDEIERKGLDRKKIAQNGGRLVFKQIFEDGFFHADPHPGNLFVLENNVIAPVDYGMTGKLSDSDLQELSDVLISAVTWDPAGVIKAYRDGGALDESVNIKVLETDITDFLYRYHRVPLSRINMRDIINEAFDIIHRHNIRLQSQLMLLGKALATYEEVARMLDPDYDLVTELVPFVRKLYFRRFKPSHILRDMLSGLYDLKSFFKIFPFELKRISQKLGKGEMGFVFEHKGLDKLILEMERSSNRVSFSLIIAAIIVGSSLVMRLETKLVLFEYPMFGILGYIFAGILGVWLTIAILRSGKL